MTWTISKPPNETLVEVEHNGEVIRVFAFFGRDGYLPHWRSECESKTWPPSAFTRWRPIAKEAEFCNEKCPKCGATLLTNGRDKWCSFIGGGSEPVCDWLSKKATV